MQRHIPIPSLKRLKNKMIMRYIEPVEDSMPLEKKQIKAVPIMRTNHMNSAQSKQKLLLRGYKYSSRISATGEFTLEKLRDIRKAASLKLIKGVDFDPYFCESSCLRSLAYTLKKLRMANSVNLTIRRVDRLNQTNIVARLLPRLLRMTKLSIQFASVKEIDNEGIKVIARAFSKCVILESLAMDYTYLPNVTSEGFLPIVVCFERLKNLKNLYNKKLLCPFTHTCDQKIKRIKFPQLKHLKSLVMIKGLKSGWVERSPMEEQEYPLYMMTIAEVKTLVNYGYIFDRFHFTPEILISILMVIPKLPLLRSVTFGFTNCRLSEVEISIMFQAIEKFTHLKQLTLKITQTPSVREEQIVSLAERLSRLKNFEKFDCYFRGVTVMNTRCFIDDLSRIDAVNFSLGKKSVHLYR